MQLKKKKKTLQLTRIFVRFLFSLYCMFVFNPSYIDLFILDETHRESCPLVSHIWNTKGSCFVAVGGLLLVSVVQ